MRVHSQVDLEAILFRLMDSKGFGAQYVSCYRLVSAFMAARQPLVILLCGAPWTGLLLCQHVSCYRLVSAFMAARQPLVILLCGAPWTGLSLWELHALFWRWSYDCASAWVSYDCASAWVTYDCVGFCVL